MSTKRFSTPADYIATIFGSLFILFVLGGIAFISEGGCKHSFKTKSDMSRMSKDDIIKILCRAELTDKIDEASGLTNVTIGLTMNTDMTFKYFIKGDNQDRTMYTTNATGTYVLVGDVSRVQNDGWKDNYGNDVGKYHYQQMIKFSGVTDRGRHFVLKASLTQFGEKKELEDRLFFGYENYTSNQNDYLSVDNFRMPTAYIYF